MTYTPKPLRPYIPAPTRPYVPASTKPYIPASVKPFFHKPDPRNVAAALNDSEVEALKAIGEAGGAASVLEVSHRLGRTRNRTIGLCEALGEADYINLFDTDVCRMKRLGWQEFEERQGQRRYARRLYHYIDVSPREFAVLQALAELGGAANLSALAHKLGVERRDVFPLCQTLGREEYVHLFQSRLCMLNRRGWQQLEKGGYYRSPKALNVSHEEFQVLKVIGEVGGEVHVAAVAEKLRTDRIGVRKQRDFVDLLLSGLCLLKRKGWEELEKGEYRRPERSLNVTPEELRVLRAINGEGGDTSIPWVAIVAELELQHARTLCKRLADRDYIDMFRSGRCVLKGRGKRELEKVQGITSR